MAAGRNMRVESSQNIFSQPKRPFKNHLNVGYIEESLLKKVSHLVSVQYLFFLRELVLFI